MECPEELASPRQTRPIITLTTDFGTAGPYVGAMKGVILGICPEVRIVDITHSIPPQDIRFGALILADAAFYFPPGTIHIAVVDPGVGTKRALIYAEIGQQRFLAPDNGLLTLVFERGPVGRIIRLENSRYWRPEVSATFHGRDILAPVSAHLAGGLEPSQLGPEISEPVLLNWPQPIEGSDELAGEVVAVDTFGNLITNINAEHLVHLGRPEELEVEILSQRLAGICRTYGDRRPGEVVALVGSAARLEIAVVCGHAASRLAAQVGTPVRVRRLSPAQ
ncbi:MAG: SAM-dependent chlorinase/fluorinase [Thermoguttaceae bacterium]|nr:SAM-dependent chlorinase/fluorinase [Thermoguttaceae bacterium]MDW8078395.1 SAM-dependent chlorinase/fluorinase [Thermoguttaceae bacterium]